MARPLRIEFPNALYHVTSRGNERKSIFKDDAGRRLFLNILDDVAARFNWIVHAYCLMDNHYHILIETPDANLSKGMRELNGVYTQSFNRRHGRAGHLFQGRYKAVVIEKQSHLLEVARYIVLNPVRAKMVDDAAKWPWSSYGGTCGIGRAHPCLKAEWILSQFGAKRGRARRRYIKFVAEGIGEQSPWERIEAGMALGGAEFIKRIAGMVEKPDELGEINRAQRFAGRPKLEEMFVVGDTKIRRNKMVLAAVTQYGYSQMEVARAAGLHYSTVSRMVKKSKVKT